MGYVYDEAWFYKKMLTNTLNLGVSKRSSVEDNLIVKVFLLPKFFFYYYLRLLTAKDFLLPKIYSQSLLIVKVFLLWKISNCQGLFIAKVFLLSKNSYYQSFPIAKDFLLPKIS